MILLTHIFSSPPPPFLSCASLWKSNRRSIQALPHNSYHLPNTHTIHAISCKSTGSFAFRRAAEKAAGRRRRASASAAAAALCRIRREAVRQKNNIPPLVCVQRDIHTLYVYHRRFLNRHLIRQSHHPEARYPHPDPPLGGRSREKNSSLLEKRTLPQHSYKYR